VTAPAFLVPAASLGHVTVGSTVAVEGDEGRHGGSVKRLRQSEQVDLVDGEGRRVTGVVEAVHRDSFTVRVTAATDEPARQPQVIVVQALAKGDRAELAVEMLTECGVDLIVPWSADHSVTVWRDDRAQRGLRRWRAVSRAAAKQSRRSRLPVISDLSDSQRVAELLAAASLGLVLHESAAARLSRVAIPSTGCVVLVVGPEGGISPAELALFAECLGLPVRMGASVLRTSTAGVAAASVVMANSGRWH
jgi:16S rRNA (uracil1498-N3)-methyltransferase